MSALKWVSRRLERTRSGGETGGAAPRRKLPQVNRFMGGEQVRHEHALSRQRLSEGFERVRIPGPLGRGAKCGGGERGVNFVVLGEQFGERRIRTAVGDGGRLESCVPGVR